MLSNHIIQKHCELVKIEPHEFLVCHIQIYALHHDESFISDALFRHELDTYHKVLLLQKSDSVVMSSLSLVMSHIQADYVR